METLTQPTYVAALCVLAANNGQAVPALTHVVGRPDESAEHLLGRAVFATRQQFPGCSIVDYNVAAVDMPAPDGLDSIRADVDDWLMSEEEIAGIKSMHDTFERAGAAAEEAVKARLERTATRKNYVPAGYNWPDAIKPVQTVPLDD